MKRAFVLVVLVPVLVVWVAGRSIYAGPQEVAPISGKVVETMDSGGYTYALLEEGGKKTWVAVPQMKISKGQKISFLPGIEMVNFESKTLKRKFDKIVFSGGPLKQ